MFAQQLGTAIILVFMLVQQTIPRTGLYSRSAITLIMYIFCQFYVPDQNSARLQQFLFHFAALYDKDISMK